MFLIGNKLKNGHLTSKCFQIVNGKTEAIADMPTPRESFGACVGNNYIMTAGGLMQGQKVCNNVEWYHTKEDRWATLPPLPAPCHGLSITVYNEKWILGAGGQDSDQKQMTRMIRLCLKPMGEAWETINCKLPMGLSSMGLH